VVVLYHGAHFGSAPEVGLPLMVLVALGEPGTPVISVPWPSGP